MEQKNNEQKNFGENIRLLRKAHRLSQKEMAKIMGTSVYCVRKAEQGIFVRSFYADAFVDLSRHFHLRPSVFFTPQEEWDIDWLLNGEEGGTQF